MNTAVAPGGASEPSDGGRLRGSLSFHRLSDAGRIARGAVRRIPRAGRICFAIAFVNAAVWGVVVPPFQVPDEISHFGYAQYFAETGKPVEQVAKELGAVAPAPAVKPAPKKRPAAKSKKRPAAKKSANP